MSLPATPNGAPGTFPATTLEPGVPLTLVSAVASAVLTGSYWFTVQPRPSGDDRTLNLQAIGLGAVPTTVTANLEQSEDGGVSWQAVPGGSALALVATGAGAPQKVTGLVAGPLYRVNPTTVTLGSATNVSIVGSLT